MTILTIGLTGGIGSGKSAVSDWFANQGIDVIDADVIAHTLITKGSAVACELVAVFGDWVIDDDGNYNRRAMREHILHHPSAINTLNAITHPHIQKRIIAALCDSDSVYRILSVPLLIEGMGKPYSLAKLCHRILVVDAPMSVQIKRTLKRDHAKLSACQDPTAYIKTIINKQATRQKRLAAAHDVVDNSGTLDSLYAQLKVLHQKYLSYAMDNPF